MSALSLSARRRAAPTLTVLGVDPGTAVTGYGVVGRADGGVLSLRECGVVRTQPNTELASRLRDIFEGVTEVIDRHRPDAVAVEGVFAGKNVRTAVVLGHARGAILLAAALRGIPVLEYPPAEVKSAVVGHGRATKEQVGWMVQRHLSLATLPTPHDAADGIAVALCHCFRGLARVAAPEASGASALPSFAEWAARQASSAEAPLVQPGGPGTPLGLRARLDAARAR